MQTGLADPAAAHGVRQHELKDLSVEALVDCLAHPGGLSGAAPGREVLPAQASRPCLLTAYQTVE